MEKPGNVKKFMELVHDSSKDYLKEEGLSEKERNILHNLVCQTEYGLEESS